ncbi:MAG: leucyl aminopeptidase [Planctomycetes bacterium]|nr:leucyl aminopeptidase [Planctomycetota bacterium]
MKKIIDVSLKCRNVHADKCKTDLLCVALFSKAKTLEKTCERLDKKLGGAIAKLIKLGDFKGSEGEIAVLYGNNKISAKRVMLVGLGEKKKVTLDTLRSAASKAASKAVALKAATLSLALHSAVGDKFDNEALAQAIAEGVCIGGYRYDEYITESENGRLGSLKVELIDSNLAKLEKLSKGIKNGSVVGKAQSYARTIANRPGNVITPASLAAEARKLASRTKGLSCSVFDKKKLTAKGMGGILAVGSGSKNEPRLIVLKYSPNGAAKGPVVGLVGKAVTFDSGGISIKPSANMDQMKFDKSGGIAVLGAMKAIAELGLKVRVYGIIPAAENMPSGTSYRPGDIVTTYSGKTVEIQNTDAEGRMILCDALHYAVKQKCDMIIDIATLTGSCVVALGKYSAGVMGNNDGLISKIEQAAKDSGEKVWHLPSGGDYLEEMKSKIADLKNIGSRWGGACTAASFLGEFVGKTKWAHIDMAGVEMFVESKQGGVGSSGYGVRLLTSLVQNIKKK